MERDERGRIRGRQPEPPPEVEPFGSGYVWVYSYRTNLVRVYRAPVDTEAGESVGQESSLAPPIPLSERYGPPVLEYPTDFSPGSGDPAERRSRHDDPEGGCRDETPGSRRRS